VVSVAGRILGFLDWGFTSTPINSTLEASNTYVTMGGIM
jgi:hypothetical protein